MWWTKISFQNTSETKQQPKLHDYFYTIISYKLWLEKYTFFRYWLVSKPIKTAFHAAILHATCLEILKVEMIFLQQISTSCMKNFTCNSPRAIFLQIFVFQSITRIRTMTSCMILFSIDQFKCRYILKIQVAWGVGVTHANVLSNFHCNFARQIARKIAALTSVL